MALIGLVFNKLNKNKFTKNKQTYYLSSNQGDVPVLRRLGTDLRGILYRKLPLNLLQLYFFTGILCNYSGWFYVNNLVLIFFIVITLALFYRKITFSPLLLFYALMTSLSLFNHAWFFDEIDGILKGAGTMPIVFLAMLACRVCTIPGLFERAVIVNTLPLAILLTFGGIHFSAGRFYSEYLTEFFHGFIPQFAFAIGIVTVFDRRFRPLLMISFLSSSIFMVVSSSRKFLIFIVIVIFLLVFSKRNFSIKLFLSNLTIVFLLVFLIVPKMIESERLRFGDDFDTSQHLQDLMHGEAKDVSSITRLALFYASVKAANDHWLGFGHGNFPYVLMHYNDENVGRTVGHPHSGLAESLIIGGYFGAAIYIIMLLYLFRLGYSDTRMRLCLIVLFMEIIVGSPFLDKIIWPMMAIAERELQISMSYGFSSREMNWQRKMRQVYKQ